MAEVRVPEIEGAAGVPDQSPEEMHDLIIARLRAYMGRRGIPVTENPMARSPEQGLPPQPPVAAPEQSPGEMAAQPGEEQVTSNLDAARLALTRQQQARANAANQGQGTI